MSDNNVVPFPSAEDREVARLSEAFYDFHAGNRMVLEITARWGLRTIIEEQIKELDPQVAPRKPIDAGLLQLHYQNCLGQIVPRHAMDYDDWHETVMRLKGTDPAHAAALEEWGMHHFNGIIEAMLDEFLEDRA